MALAYDDVHISISVIAIVMDDVLPIERVVPVKWLVRLKAVGVDTKRLLLGDRQQELNH
jgi:hypothetical protein